MSPPTVLSTGDGLRIEQVTTHADAIVIHRDRTTLCAATEPFQHSNQLLDLWRVYFNGLLVLLPQSQRDSMWAAEPSRSQPSIWACSLSCWPRRRETATKRVWTSGRMVMSPQSFSNWMR